MEEKHTMTQGVWTGEIYGPYGWENNGVYVLDHGQIFGGNDRHYSSGRYNVSGDIYNADISVHYYGPPRSIFGENQEQFEITVTGTLGEGVIAAKVSRPDKPEFSVEYRMTKRMSFPASSG